MTRLFLMVGPPAAGKTQRAKELAAQHGALRLSPDSWMIPMFGEPDADGKRDVPEGRLIWLALEALRVDLQMAGLGGIGVVTELARTLPSCAVVILTGHGARSSYAEPSPRAPAASSPRAPQGQPSPM